MYGIYLDSVHLPFKSNSTVNLVYEHDMVMRVKTDEWGRYKYSFQKFQFISNKKSDTKQKGKQQIPIWRLMAHNGSLN